MRRFTVWIAKKSGELLEAVPVLYETVGQSTYALDSLTGYEIVVDYRTEDSIAGYLVTGPGMKTFQFINKEFFEREAEYLGEL